MTPQLALLKHFACELYRCNEIIVEADSILISSGRVADAALAQRPTIADADTDIKPTLPVEDGKLKDLSEIKGDLCAEARTALFQIAGLKLSIFTISPTP